MQVGLAIWWGMVVGRGAALAFERNSVSFCRKPRTLQDERLGTEQVVDGKGLFDEKSNGPSKNPRVNHSIGMVAP